MDFAPLPSTSAATWTGDDGSTAPVLVQAVRPKGDGVEYLCIASDGKTHLLNASTLTFSKVPTGDPVRLRKAKGAAKKSR